MRKISETVRKDNLYLNPRTLTLPSIRTGQVWFRRGGLCGAIGGASSGRSRCPSKRSQGDTGDECRGCKLGY